MAEVLDAASLKAAFTPVKTKENETIYNAKGNGYGFGWFIGRDRGLRVISHGGGLPGFSSMLVRLPDQKFTVAVLVNALPCKPGTEPQALAHQLAEIFLADKLAPLPIVNTNVSPKSYDVLTGHYETMGTVLTITRRDTHLYAQIGNQPEAELFPTSTTEFFCKVVDASCTFVKDSGGKVVKLIFDYDSMVFIAPRTKDSTEVKVAPEIYDSLVGKYDYGNGAVLAVTRDGNHLFAQLTGQPKFEIFPKSDTEYFWKVADAQLTFVKDATGKATKAIHHQNGQTIDAPKIQ